MQLYLLVIAIILSAAIAITVKYAAHDSTPQHHVMHYLLISVALSIALVISFYYLFQTRSLSTTYSITKVASIVLAVIAGIWLFGERLTWPQIAGIGLGMASIYLITLGDTH